MGLVGALTALPATVPPKPHGIGRRINVTPQPVIATAHDGAIELLRQELLGRIDGQMLVDGPSELQVNMVD